MISRPDFAPKEPPQPSGKLLLMIPRRGGRGKPDVEVRITLDAYDGHPFLGMRLWEKSLDGNFYPTPKGITIRKGEAFQVIRALCAGAREMGVELQPKPPPSGDGSS